MLAVLLAGGALAELVGRPFGFGSAAAIAHATSSRHVIAVVRVMAMNASFATNQRRRQIGASSAYSIRV